MVRKSIFVWLFVTVGCVRGDEAPKLTVEPIAPPKVERCDPIKFSLSELDSTTWKVKTNPDKIRVWFKEEGGQWWIDWDAERRPLRRIIIHHSDSPTDWDSRKMSDVARGRLYYGEPRSRYGLASDDPYVVGMPAHSGHVINVGETDSHETFSGYHHLIYPDGRVTTELQPLVKVGDQWLIDMVGWHASKWTINCESIGICIMGNFMDDWPTREQLEATNHLVAYYRTFVPDLVVEPHRQRSATKCPGDTWDQWKELVQGE